MYCCFLFIVHYWTLLSLQATSHINFILHVLTFQALSPRALFIYHWQDFLIYHWFYLIVCNSHKLIFMLVKPIPLFIFLPHLSLSSNTSCFDWSDAKVNRNQPFSAQKYTENNPFKRLFSLLITKIHRNQPFKEALLLSHHKFSHIHTHEHRNIYTSKHSHKITHI